MVIFIISKLPFGQNVEKANDTYLDERASYKLLEQYFPLDQRNHDQIK